MKRLLTLLALTLLSALAWAGDKGYLGMDVAVEGEGFFLNPTLKAARITRVVAGSPAAQAGITAGDLIVEVEGHPVVGAKARELEPYLEHEVGQTVRMVLRKPSGKDLPVSLVTVPRPH